MARAVVPDRDRVPILEARRALDHPHAEPGEPLAGIVRRNGCDHAMHMGMDPGEIDARPLRRDAERRRPTERLGALGRGEQRLRGHATIVEAIAAHLALLDQHHGHAEGGGGGGDRQPAGARPDDANIGRQ